MFDLLRSNTLPPKIDVLPTTPELGATTYSYDGANRLTETTYANLAKEIRTYDNAGRLLTLKHERAGGTVHSEIYEFDPNGNRTKLTQNDGVSTRITTYGFDSADRLVSESNPDERLEDTLDAAGNRTQRLVKNGAGVLQKTITYTINARDQITQVQEKNASNVITKTETFVFDADGSRISKSDGSSTTTYKYDRRGRQVQAGAVVYELNDADVRTAKTDGTRTDYVMEGLKLVAEVQGATTLANYRWGGQLIGEVRSGTAKTILQDGFRSPLIVMDQGGLITDRVRYTAAGEVRQRTGSSPLAFGFGGYLTQNGTDELYAFARTYSPGTGRFNEIDPVNAFDAQMPMGPHRYVMGYGNPLVYVDPDGRCVNSVMCVLGHGLSRARTDEDVANVVDGVANLNPAMGRTYGVTKGAARAIYAPFAMAKDAADALAGDASAQARTGARLNQAGQAITENAQAFSDAGLAGVAIVQAKNRYNTVAGHVSAMRQSLSSHNYVQQGEAGFDLGMDAAESVGGTFAAIKVARSIPRVVAESNNNVDPDVEVPDGDSFPDQLNTNERFEPFRSTVGLDFEVSMGSGADSTILIRTNQTIRDGKVVDQVGGGRVAANELRGTFNTQSGDLSINWLG